MLKICSEDRCHSQNYSLAGEGGDEKAVNPTETIRGELKEGSLTLTVVRKSFPK